MAPCTAKPEVRARLRPVVASASASLLLLRLCASSDGLCLLPFASVKPLAALWSKASCANSCVWMSTAFWRARSLTKFSEHHLFRSPLSTWTGKNSMVSSAQLHNNLVSSTSTSCSKGAAAMAPHLLVHPEHCQHGGMVAIATDKARPCSRRLCALVPVFTRMVSHSHQASMQ